MKIIKKTLFITILCLSFVLCSCKKKEVKKASIGFCFINRVEILDNKEGLDIIDECCTFARIENEFRFKTAEAGKKIKSKIIVDEGYYVKGYYFTQEYTLVDQEMLEIDDDYVVSYKPKPGNNYLIFDIRKIGE